MVNPSTVKYVVVYPTHAVLFLRVLTFTDETTWFLNSAIRALDLAVLAGVELDCRQTCACAVLHFLASLYKGYQMSQKCLMSSPAFSLFFGEFTAFFIIACVGFLLETWERQRLHALFKMEEAVNEKSSIRKLLAVFCDGLVHLDHEFRMKVPDFRVSRILQGTFDMQTHALDGEDFTKFVADTDRIRFLDFINAGIGTDESPSLAASQPPSLLHLQMRDTSGFLFQARVFHVVAPTVGGKTSHIIGICENSQRRSLEQEPPKHVQQVAPRQIKKQRNRSTASEHSQSSSSSGSRRLSKRRMTGNGMMQDLAGSLLSLSSIRVTCDPFTDDFCISDLVATFNAKPLAHIPSLRKWFLGFA